MLAFTQAGARLSVDLGQPRARGALIELPEGGRPRVDLPPGLAPVPAALTQARLRVPSDLRIPWGPRR